MDGRNPKDEKVETGGGARVEGGVRTGGGHFAGRDMTVSFHYNAPAAGAAAVDLEAALDLLRQMPTEEVPPRGALPPGSHLAGYRPNPLFVGRDADLRALARRLGGGEGVAVNGAAATGLGGVGKSQLAVEFAYRYGQFFAGGVFWISLASAESAPAHVAACGRALFPGRADFSALPLAEQAASVVQAWAGPLPRLLIFDNCEEVALLEQWRPPAAGARLLLTSRRARWPRSLGVRAGSTKML